MNPTRYRGKIMKCSNEQCKNRNKKTSDCTLPSSYIDMDKDGKCRRFDKILTPKERAEKYWKERRAREHRPDHLVYSQGMFGGATWACGSKRKHESGWFGTDGTLGNVDCEKCKQTKLYKAIKDGTYTDENYENGLYDEHPRSAAAKKAWETRKKRATNG